MSRGFFLFGLTLYSIETPLGGGLFRPLNLVFILLKKRRSVKSEEGFGDIFEKRCIE